ncbi:MAG TPA: M28 family peptidase [Luteimonas sp.]|nr:M28 family peptidase [Luteimonas sp.]
MRQTSALHLVALLSGLLALAACQRTSTPEVVSVQDNAAAAARIKTDVRYLADDALQGRQTGTPGYELAADYVAKRFAAIGLQPAGDHGSWFQAVPLLRATRQVDGARVAIRRDGKRTELRFREQFLPGLNYNAADATVEAPAVFVGQGVFAPELQHDDFAGLDLHGKIAVLFSGAPMRFDNDRRALHASTTEKLRALTERGAIGAVFVNTVSDEVQVPWTRSADNWDRPGMRLRNADGSGIGTFPSLRVTATVSASAAEWLFDGSGHSAAELFQAAQDGSLKGFALPGTLTLASRTRIEPLQSRNVVAKLPGADTTLAREHVVYSAHLDHLGVGAPVKGDGPLPDSIYNGALDNALGVSILLEAARSLHGKPAPKRSLLFVATTAEEQGLLGAQWFAAHPPGALVANINLDMPMLLAPSSDVVSIGAEHSSLQTVLQQAARDIGVGLSPDPFPEEMAFVRSDQYAFVRAGIPALYLDGGIIAAASTDPKLAQREFMRHCYHQPCDDAKQPIQYGDAARLARLNARIGLLVGNAAQRPRWNADDFFGRRFAQP